MSSFQFRFWRFGITYPGYSLVGPWRHLFWRVWWLNK
jgi:hypothetical protein